MHCFNHPRSWRGSRINTDQFPKRAPKAQASRGVWGHVPPEIFAEVFFNSLSSPSLGY